MITLEIEGISVEGFRTPPKRVDLPVFYVLYNIKGVPFDTSLGSKTTGLR
jgi:hypothetical protein